MPGIDREEGNGMQSKKGKPFRKTVAFFYVAAAAVMLLMAALMAWEQRGKQVDFGLEGFVSAEEGWTDMAGDPVDAAWLKKAGDDVTVFYTIPDMQKDTSLVYRSQNTVTEVWLDGELYYETDILKYPLFRSMPGSRWNIVTFSPEQSGSVIEFRLKAAYEGKGVQADNFYWGDRAAILLAVFRWKLPALLTSFAICLSGVFMMILDLTINFGKKRKNRNLLHMGLFSLCIGGWSLMETNVLQLAVKNTQIIQVFDNALLIISVMPLLLYADCVYGIFRYRVTRLMAVFQLAFFGVCIVLPLFGLSDWHSLLPVARAYLVVCAMGFLVWVIHMNVMFFRKKRNTYGASLQLIGIGALGVSGVAEVLRYTLTDSMDSAMVLRFGLLAFIILFAIGGQFSTYRLLSQGMEYDSVRRLAYSDTLTSLGNRTAYLERLRECVKEQDAQLGIVYLDINGLKKVNDVHGHDAGDVLIREASRVIWESFGPYGGVYRIGGDEFCVLLEKDPEESYRHALETFASKIRQVNESGKYGFQLQIAQGYADCAADSMETVETAIKAADERMYQDKMRLKSGNG